MMVDAALRKELEAKALYDRRTEALMLWTSGHWSIARIAGYLEITPSTVRKDIAIAKARK
jgi:DeoR/GlpR family transcriptional regulator of sugar metabolism